MKRVALVGLLSVVLAFTMVACGMKEKTEVGASSQPAESVETKGQIEPADSVEILPSPDKYTWYIKNYVGMNAASLGYTSIAGNRMDSYGAGLVELVYVTDDGSYVDPTDEELLKTYVVTDQNIAPNSELKLLFQKDENGEEYDNLTSNQGYDEIILRVSKVGQLDGGSVEMVTPKASPDKYTHYVVDYVGRNLAACGYVSLAGKLADHYGAGYVVFTVISDSGEFIDVTDQEQIKRYVVTSQDVAPNTEVKMTFDVDSQGEEYDNLVNFQSIEAITLKVSLLA